MLFLVEFEGSAPAYATAGINQQMNFQGRLLNSSGAVVPDGTYNIEFKIYQDGPGNVAGDTGGTLKWTEDWVYGTGSPDNRVIVRNGYFSINLGSITSLSAVDFNQQTLWLSMNIGDQTAAANFASASGDGEMLPMKRLTASPYAMNAALLNGLSSSAFGQLSVNNTWSGTNLFQPAASASALVVSNASNAVFTVDTSGNNVVIGKPGAQTATLQFANATGSNTVGIQAGASSAAYTLTLPVAAPSTSQCLQTDASVATTLQWGSCGSGGSLTLAAVDSAGVANANGATLTGSTLNLNSASGSFAGVVNTSAQTFAGTKTFNDGLVVAASQTVVLTGSGTRPGSPTNGTLYYDTTSNQLIQYNGSKWVSDKSPAIIVAASNSLQAAKDAADFVATGTGDQAIINSALTAASGNTVYLMAGTYNLTAAISIPNGTTLAGSGAATIITIPSAQNGSYNMITNTDATTGTKVNIQNLMIDGNKTNQTTGNMVGIYFTHMGGGTGSTARVGGKINNVTVANFLGTSSYGVELDSSNNNTISGVSALNIGADGIYLTNSASYNTVSGNNTQGSAHAGIYITSGSNTITGNTSQGNNYGIMVAAGNNTVSGNTTQGSTTAGIFTLNGSNSSITGNVSIGGSYGLYIQSTNNATVTGNTSQGNAIAGIYLAGSNNNQISGNKIHDNGGSTTNEGVALQVASTKNSISGNDITDTSCSTTCYALDISSNSTGAYISGNHILGDGTHPATINDAVASGNTYSNQPLSENGDASFRNATNSATALQVQNATGNDLLAVDTSSSQVLLGKVGSGGINGKLTFNTATAGSFAVGIQSSGSTSASYNLTLPTALSGTAGDCLKDTTGTGVLGFASCGGGSSSLQGAYNGSTDPEITLATGAAKGISILDASGTPVAGNLFEVQNNGRTQTYFAVSATGFLLQNASGNSALAFDNSTNTLKVYGASGSGYASISYNDGTSTATFAASTGTTQLGNGGSVTGNLTGATDTYFFKKTYTPSAAYSLDDFTVQRVLTGAANSLTGSILKVEDNSTGSNSAPTVLYVNQNNASTLAGGNLIVAKTVGSTTQFSVSDGGVVFANAQIQAPLFDTPSGTTTLNIGTNNATAGINLNQGTTITTSASGTALTVSGVTSGTALNASGISTGTGVNLQGLTTGIGINLGGTNTTTGTGIKFNTTSDLLGTVLSVTGSALSPTVGNFGGNLINIAPTRTNTATSGTLTDNGSYLNIARSNTQNGTGGTFALAGNLVNIQSNCTQAAGTCTDSSTLLNVNQQYSNATGSAVVIKNSGQGSALQVQNASGTSLLKVDTADLKTWQTASTFLPDVRSEQSTVTANGYVYSIGGVNISGTKQTSVYYAKLNSDGSVGSWGTATNSLPAARSDASAVTANGYVYILGGLDAGGTGQSTVYYAKLNADGSVGQWKTAANSLLATVYDATSIVANGYVYVIGGTTTSVYYAKLNSDGSVGAWTSSGNTLPAVRRTATSVVANGYVYVIGGSNGSAQASVYYAQLNSDGSIGSWSTAANSLPAAVNAGTSVVSNGYVYVMGGVNAQAVYYSKLNANGSVNTWSTATNSLPGKSGQGGSVIANGYIYVVGGSTSGVYTGSISSVYYSSTQRITVGGSLDLVGVAGQTLADPGSSGLGTTGGSITAGNGTFVGDLQVQGQSTLQSVSVNGGLNVGGTATVQTQTNSVNAFQVQNANSDNLFQVDSANNNIIIGGNNAGTLQPWQTAINTLTAGRYSATSVVANGYIYEIGGINGAVQSTVYYSKINSDGSVGTWTTASNPLTNPRAKATSVIANGYVYVIGGVDTTSPQSTVYYSKLNSDGSVGSWRSASNTLPNNRLQTTSVAANGYVYVMGGLDAGVGSSQTSVYYAKLNSDGSVGSWSTSSNALPDSRDSATSILANGYVYVIGGNKTISGSGTTQTTIYYAKLNGDGTVGAWSTNTGNPLPASILPGTSAVANGYVYVIGQSAGNNNLYYAKLNSDGTIGAWTTVANSLPAALYSATSVTANGYIYVLGGADAGTNTPLSSVYYASTERVKIGGSLDLVGLGAQNLADSGSSSLGSTGGSLTAGNGIFVGDVQVQGQSLLQGVVVNGSLNVGSTATIQTQTNVASAFQVQNSSGNLVFGVDTSVNTAILGAASNITGSLAVYNSGSTYKVTITSAATATGDYTLTLPTDVASVAAGQCLKASSIASRNVQLGFSTCGTTTSAVTLSPEYQGATMTGVGGSNIGTMTSDFCSGTSRLSVNTSICAATDEHNYYSWTTSQGTAQNYDIYIRYQIPSDFSAFTSSSALSMYGWGTVTGTDKVELALFQQNGTQCGSTTNVATSSAAWTSTALSGTITSCSISAGDKVTFRIRLTAVSGDFARAGGITFSYNKL